MKRVVTLATVAILIVFLMITMSIVKGADIRAGIIAGSYYLEEEKDFNTVNDGVFLTYNDWVLGSYTNRVYRESKFFGKRWYFTDDIDFELVVATGFENELISSDGWLPVMSLNYTWKLLRVGLTPDGIRAGLELDFSDF